MASEQRFQLRKVWQFAEMVHAEGGRQVAHPARVVATAAVVTDFLAGEWVDDLQALIDVYSAELGAMLAARTIELLGEPVEAFGKGVLVGAGCEIEHGSAIVHNLRFGNPIRRAAGDAATLLPAVEKRGSPGSSMDIPLKHIHDDTVRSHHQTFEIRVPDAPLADEIVIAVAMAAGGRPHARLKASGNDLGTTA